MCQCGFCGTNLTRRSHHQDTQHKKPVWKCRTAANKGIENCPHSKAIDEVIIENAFLEMFRLLAENFDDVLESVLSSLETAISKDDSTEKLKRVEKEISTLEKKRKKLTDMYLDDKISKEAYEEKYSELNHKLDKCEEEKLLFSENALSQKNIASRMKTIRAKLKRYYKGEIERKNTFENRVLTEEPKFVQKRREQAHSEGESISEKRND